ncbi:MAG: hypothetical protein ABI286_07445 [Edaphobacter sp.]
MPPYRGAGCLGDIEAVGELTAGEAAFGLEERERGEETGGFHGDGLVAELLVENQQLRQRYGCSKTGGRSIVAPAIFVGTERGAERPVRVIWRIAAKPLE